MAEVLCCPVPGFLWQGLHEEGEAKHSTGEFKAAYSAWAEYMSIRIGVGIGIGQKYPHVARKVVGFSIGCCRSFFIFCIIYSFPCRVSCLDYEVSASGVSH